jgi:type IV secretion system protein VirB9
MMRIVFLSVVMCLSSIAVAQNDTSRIQNVEYGRKVIALTLAEGVTTTIELPPDETITREPIFGDSKAWHVARDGNLIALKPREPNAGTNLTIYGNKRAYLFRLDALAQDAWYVPYWVTVAMPVAQQPNSPSASLNRADTITATLSPQQKATRASALIEREFGVSRYRGRINFDYWAQGSRQLQPIAMHDNGMHTYLTFADGLPFPAAFVFDADGNETTVNFHVEKGNTMVLHRVTDRVLLRRGQVVTGITNASYAPTLSANPSATVSPNVDRLIKPSAHANPSDPGR